MAVEALQDPTHLLITSSQLQNGKPIGNALVTLFPSQIGIRTDHTGVALMELPLPTPESGTVAEYLVVRHGTDSALLQGRFFSGIEKDGWFRKPLKKRLNWFVFDDRLIYRPGEEVHFKGWIRAIESKPGGDIIGISTQPTPLSFEVKDLIGNTVATGHLTTNRFGGFDGKFRLPESTVLGLARIYFEIVLPEAQANVGRQTHWHSFQVEEFRRPEFQVSIQPPAPLQMAGSSAELVAQATYFSGNGLSEAEVRWTIATSETSYTPPNWDQFTFGKWHPWWDVTYPEFQNEQSFTGKTDGLGRHQLHLDFESVNPPFPTLVQVEATVADVNRQQIYNSTQFLVHPATQYVGLNPRRSFSTPGEPFEIETIVTTIDGVAQIARTVQFQVFRIQRSYHFGLWQETEEIQGTGQITTDQTPVIWRFTPTAGGEYVIRARVVDDQGRPSETEASVWVSREKRHFTNWVNDLEFELIPDKKEYQPGETAHVLVNSPFLPAQGMMTVERDGIITYHSIELNELSQVLHVPLEDNFIPAIRVSVYLRGEMVRADEDGTELFQLPKCPISATGWIEIPVSSRSRTLSVTAKPLVDQLAPGSATTINLEVRDHTGKPVPESECVVAVVDEAILALVNGEIQDPVEVMHRDQLFGSNFQTLRDSIRRASESELTTDITSLLQVRPAADRFLPITSYVLKRQARITTEESSSKNREAGPQSGLAQDAIATPNQSAQPIPLRSNFDPLAVFAPSVVTDADGKAVVTVTMPDNLTRYRVIALATDGEKCFGKGESTITTWLPLMVRPSAPRFLNFGDEFELPVTIHNQTDQAQHIKVAIQSGQMNFPQGAGHMVLVPAHDRVEVRFPAIPQTTGAVFFQVVASSDLASDAASGSFPVKPPTMTEAVATYGELQGGTIQLPLTIPTDARPEFSQLEMTTSSTQLQTLTDAVLYLMDYPYRCTEQIASRILAITALQEVLTELRALGRPTPEAYQTQVAADLDQLEKVHDLHGGFGFWSRSEKPLPFLSIHVAHALIRAKQKGYTVPHFLLGSSKDYLSKIKDHIPKEYSPESRQTLLAYALYVRHLTGDSDAGAARELVKETGADKLPIEAIGWLLPVLAKNPDTKLELSALLHVMSNRITETAGAASFVESYSDGAAVLLHSNRRTDAVILDALLLVKPDSDLIPKLVRGLLAHRVNGRWSNTQENAFVLLALERYFSTFEKQTPDFLARVWLHDTFAGEHRFAGRTADQHQIGIPLNQVGKPGETKSITLGKNGVGRMYYRLGLSYAPKEVMLPPLEAGFTISREYSAVDNPADVKRISATEWQIRAGARVKVTVRMVAPARRAHVALSCPLPAGLEILNPALATTPRLPDDEEPPRLNWWQRSWFDHQNLRDNRAEAFTALLSEGVYTYSFFAVATTPGKFLVPPAKAEEMYSPETFGRSQTEIIKVTDE
ncbi:MAG: hypothetical protein HY774_07990 [Acidobacteria bacterium]|nr:hypothetical protein [Acidobacteriota bacterium]